MAALLLSGLEAFSPGLQAPAVQTRSAAPAMVIGQQAESFGPAAVLRKLKQAIDPQGILNPGNLLPLADAD